MSYVSQEAIYEAALAEAQSIANTQGEENRQNIQRRLDDIARRRTKIARQQKKRRDDLINQANVTLAANKKTVDDLKRKQANRLKIITDNNTAAINKINRDTAKQVRGIQRAGGAAATSLRILGQVQPVGPNAQQSRRGQFRRAAGTTSANVARGTSSIRGTNLSI